MVEAVPLLLVAALAAPPGTTVLGIDCVLARGDRLRDEDDREAIHGESSAGLGAALGGVRVGRALGERWVGSVRFSADRTDVAVDLGSVEVIAGPEVEHRFPLRPDVDLLARLSASFGWKALSIGLSEATWRHGGGAALAWRPAERVEVDLGLRASALARRGRAQGRVISRERGLEWESAAGVSVWMP